MHLPKNELIRGVCLLLVALLLVGGLWLFTKEEPEKAPIEGDEAEAYMITLHCGQRMKDPYNDLEIGDTVYSLERSGELGQVVSLRLMDWVSEVYDDEAGVYRAVVDPEEKMIEVQIKAMGKLRAGKFTVDGVKMAVGQTIYPETDECRMVANVWSIEKIEEAAK